MEMILNVEPLNIDCKDVAIDILLVKTGVEVLAKQISANRNNLT